MDREYEATFDGETVATGLLAPDLPRLIMRLRLLPCMDTNAARRCPFAHERHAHIYAAMFAGMPIHRGGRDFYIATIPEIGEISYAFDAEHQTPPPIRFKPTC